MALSPTITAEQLRAARAMLKLEQTEMAELAGVSHGTIRRLEALSGPLSAQGATLDSIIDAIARAGVMLIGYQEGDPKGGYGVRFVARQSEPTEEQIEWIKDHLREALAERINDRPVEQLRGQISGAIVDGLMLAQESYGDRFPESSGEIFGKAAGIIIAEMTSGIVSPVPPTKNPRKHYNRADPDKGAVMSGARPVARRSQIRPTSDDDESE